MKLCEIKEMFEMIAWGSMYMILASIMLFTLPLWIFPYAVYKAFNK